MRIFLLLFLALTLNGCGSFLEKFGRLQGETLVTINLNREHNPTSVIYPMYGGVWIVLKSESGADFMKTVFLSNETTQVQISAPNGVYKAGAIGWEGNATPGCTPGTDCYQGQGQAKCDIAYNDTTFTLDGTAKTIPFVLAQVNCQNPPWGGAPFSDVAYNPTGDSNFPQIKFYFTAGTFNISSWNVQVVMNMQTRSAGSAVIHAQTKMACTSMAGGQVLTPLRLPVGKTGDSILSYTVNVHPSGDTSCTGTPTGVFSFPNGLISAPTSTTHTVSSFSIAYAAAINTISFDTN